MQDVLSKPVELIDQDLDAVAGGFFDINIADIDQTIAQANVSSLSTVLSLTDVDQSNTAANAAAVSQSS